MVPFFPAAVAAHCIQSFLFIPDSANVDRTKISCKREDSSQDEGPVPTQVLNTHCKHLNDLDIEECYCFYIIKWKMTQSSKIKGFYDESPVCNI